MPYIKQDRRVEIREGDFAENPGELNFMITDLLVEYVSLKGLSYQTINDIVGVLEGAKLEFYSRIARPYEDKKLDQSGDVYDGI